MRRTNKLWSLLATLGLAAGLLVALPGCGDPVGPESSTVGGMCSSDADCDEKCLTGDDWPGGMCTLSCNSNGDCPPGSACIEEERGVCLIECRGDDDCPSGYECDDEDREDGRGKADVCVED